MPAMVPQPVWLVTGASSGLGAAITSAALRAGHKVIAGARNTSKARKDYPQVEELGGEWLELDVTAPNVKQTITAAIEKAGRIDVVVNNAGFITVAPLEDLSDEETDAQMSTNFTGTLNTTRAVIPFMRAQQSGHIINMSSVFGYSPQAGAVMYTASKHAVEGLTSALALELASFSIKFLLLEPGFFRTQMCRNRRIPANALHEAYDVDGGAVKYALGVTELAAKVPERMAGDPAKLAQRVLEWVEGRGLGGVVKEKGLLRLPLGKDAMFFWRKQIKELQDNLEAVAEVAGSAAFDA